MSIARGWYIVIHDDKTQEAAQAWFNAHPGLIGGIELRLDLTGVETPLPAPPANLSVIVTDRGGRTDHARTARRDQICREWRGTLDVDPQTDAAAPNDLPWIYSCHRTADTSVTVQSQIDEAQRSGAVAAKIVMPEGDLTARRQALAQAPSDGTYPVVCFSAGDQSPIDRLVALDRQQPWGYARVPADDPGIPGLPSIGAIVDRYRFRRCDSQRPLQAVIGVDVENHLAPGWHNRWLEGHRSPTRMIQFSTDQPDPFLEESDKLQLDALSVCAPYQQWARQVARPLDGDASRWSRWDTLIRQPDRSWVGTSCETIAVRKLLQQHLSRQGPLVIVGREEDSQMLAVELTRLGYPVSRICSGCEHRPESREHRQGAEAIDQAAALIHCDRSYRTGSRATIQPDSRWDLTRFDGELVIDMAHPLQGHPQWKTLESNAVTVVDALDFFSEQMRLQCRWLHRGEVTRGEAVRIAREALEELQ
ncbi:MAG TPA: hypothetical protein EYQ08_13225 [Planctomycetes bacterium]|nr:hypothetical protein [Planctomycetota bacterium]